MEILLEFLKIVLPAAIVLYAMYVTVKSFIQKELQTKSLDIQATNVKTVLPIRLQAYERMCLFLERITPNNLLLRLNEPGLSAKQLQHIIVKDIREEFNHNLSQQIYMSDQVWQEIKSTVEDIITLVNKSSEKMSENAKGMDLAKEIINDYVSKSEDSIGNTLYAVKEEIRQIY